MVHNTKTDPLRASGVRTYSHESKGRVHVHYFTTTMWQFMYYSIPISAKGASNRAFGASQPSLGFEPLTRGIYVLCILSDHQPWYNEDSFSTKSEGNHH